MNSPRASSFVRRRLGTVAAVLGGLAILHVTAPGGLAGVAADLRDSRVKNAELAEYEQDNAELNEQMAVAGDRTAYRLDLLDRLVANRLGVRAAADDFRGFVGADPRFDRMLFAVSAGEDDAERVANYLLTSLVRARPLAPATRQRLADEFRREFGRPPAFVEMPYGVTRRGSPDTPAPLHLVPESAHCQ